jgi:hypothetical protein
MNLFEKLPLPPVFYHGREGSYWREDSRSGWIKINETSVRLFVADHGYAKKNDGSVNSEADECVMRVQAEQNVVYAAPLAGYDAGSYDMNGKTILVTEGPKRIVPKAGEWPTLARLFEGMFVDGEVDQRSYFYGWLKSGLATFRSGTWRASQMLALAGDAGSGKSLTQNLITELFGGRCAKPYQFMRGGTEFNSQLFSGEHLMLEDESESVDMRSRRHFGAMMKTLLCGRDQNCHGKNREAVMLRPLWRMSVSLNFDPERLLVLPPLDDDVCDKIIALKVVNHEMPMRTETEAEKERFWQTLVSELPAFAAYLETWNVPEDLRDERYGIRAFQHAEIVERLNATSSEIRLLELIDLTLFRNQFERRAWVGSAAELERRLTDEQSAFRDEARRLLNWNAACGSYLGRLEKCREGHHAGRVASRLIHGRREWTIQPPARDEGEAWITPVGDSCPPQRLSEAVRAGLGLN